MAFNDFSKVEFPIPSEEGHDSEIPDEEFAFFRLFSPDNSSNWGVWMAPPERIISLDAFAVNVVEFDTNCTPVAVYEPFSPCDAGCNRIFVTLEKGVSHGHRSMWQIKNWLEPHPWELQSSSEILSDSSTPQHTIWHHGSGQERTLSWWHLTQSHYPGELVNIASGSDEWHLDHLQDLDSWGFRYCSMFERRGTPDRFRHRYMMTAFALIHQGISCVQ